MKLIIAGGRDLNVSTQFIDHAMDFFGIMENGDPTMPPEEIVSGGADGIDFCGEQFAIESGTNFVRFPADWKKYGNAAGPIRNHEMAKYADALLLIWNGSSKGSANMRQTMLQLKKPIYEIIMRKHG